MTPQELYHNYSTEIREIISTIQTLKGAGVALILSNLATRVVPQMMSDVGELVSLTGDEKKQLILDSLDFGVVEIFKELNENTSLKDESWDEIVRDVLKQGLPRIIDLLITVEDNKIVFNKKVGKCLFSCCFK